MSLTEAQAYEAIRQRWVDNWPTQSSGVPYSFNGEAVDPVGAGGPPFAEALIVDGDSRQDTLGPEGSRQYRRTGTVLVICRVAADTGDSAARALRDIARKIYEGTRFGGGVNCGSTPSSSTARGSQVNGRYWISSVEIPFWFHEQR